MNYQKYKNLIIHSSIFGIFLFITPIYFLYCSPDKPIEHNLVNLNEAPYNFKVNLAYSTEKNRFKTSFYKLNTAYLIKDAADSLLKVNKKLESLGLEIIILDAYRPYSVTCRMWDRSPYEDRKFLASPINGSIHNRACAIDISLISKTTNKDVEMPSKYDEFSERAHISFQEAEPEAIKNRNILIEVMENHGFSSTETEWWHFDWHEWQDYPILDLSFEELSKEKALRN